MIHHITETLVLFIKIYPQQARNILWHLINFFFCSGAEHRPERDHDGPRLADDLVHRRHRRACGHHGQEEGAASGEKLQLFFRLMDEQEPKGTNDI